jgi:hypothetical protein
VRPGGAEGLARGLVAGAVREALGAGAVVAHGGPRLVVRRGLLRELDDDGPAAGPADRADPVALHAEGGPAVAVRGVADALGVRQPQSVCAMVAVRVLHRRGDDARRPHVGGVGAAAE